MNKRLFHILNILLLLFAFSTQLPAQNLSLDEKEVIRKINEADGYFIYDEDYTKAVGIYEELFKQYPENHNLAYKLGVCYLNIPGSELKSLELLRYASENFVRDIEYSTIGNSAPFDVLYYLAFSCQVNLRIDEAIDNYQRYKKQLQVSEAAEIDYINLQIKACKNILKATDKGIILIKSLFAPWLEEYRNASNPVVSGNDSVLAFTVPSDEVNMIYVSRRIKGKWEEPELINPQLGKYRDMFTNSITDNGHAMILNRNNGIKGDLYITKFDGRSWQRISRLGKNINTRYWESHGAIRGDGKQLCFASNKPGGYGSLDLYISDIQDNGDFGPATNMGPVINTNLEENTPYLAEDGSLYFSSSGHSGYGGYDIFYSSRTNKRWSEPIHLSFPLNDPKNNLHYIPYGSFDNGIISLPSCDTADCTNIFLVKHGILPETDRFFASGEVSLGDNRAIDSASLKLELYETNKQGNVYLIKSDSEGRFTYGLDSMLYTLVISYPGYLSDTVDISVPESFSSKSILIERELIPLTIARGEFFSVKNILFEFGKAELTRDAKLALEKIIPVLIENPLLEIEIKGYTDALGSDEYNLALSGKRAESVFKYITDAGIDPVRLTKTAMGETGFISENRLADGSDNPEGRKYNRRVCVSILNNGYKINFESNRFIPRHLKKNEKLLFYVVIKESEQALNPEYFNKGQLGELTMVSEIKSGDIYKYFVGEFSRRTDAINFLATLRNIGFNESYITDEYDLSDDSIIVKGAKLYTIQIHALLNNEKQEFENLENVRIIKGDDGFFRYIVGEYRGYSRALEALEVIHSLGYRQAFIKDFSLLESQTINTKSNNEL